MEALPEEELRVEETEATELVGATHQTIECGDETFN
jgi:hypothetical protein